MKKIIIIVTFVLALLFLHNFVYAEEEITLTTYYPAPYGEYKKLSVGATYTAPTGANTDLIVEGNVGIGTDSPGRRLHVSSTNKHNALLVDETTGNVGIGATPHSSEPLEIYTNTSYGQVRLHNASNQANFVAFNNLCTGANAEKGAVFGMMSEHAWIYNAYPGGSVSFWTKPSGSPVDAIAIERMRIDSVGNVGIGTTTPGTLLDIVGESNQELRLVGTMLNEGSPKLHFKQAGHDTSASDAYIYLDDSSRLSFGVESVDPAMVIQPLTGNVGIGTTTPTGAKLQVVSSTANPNMNLIHGVMTDWPNYTPPYQFNAVLGAAPGVSGTGDPGWAALGAVVNDGLGSGNKKFAGWFSGDVIMLNGNVGIGTMTPTRPTEASRGVWWLPTLDVNGTIRNRSSRTYLDGNDGTYHWIMAGGETEDTNNALGFNITTKQVTTGLGWTKAFTINHPLDPKHKYLCHAVLEGPENAVFYRGEGRLSNGKAIILLPKYFEALTRKNNRTVLLTPKFEADEPISLLAASEVRDGKFAIRAIDDKNLSQKFYWEIKAVRADVDILKVEIAKK